MKNYKFNSQNALHFSSLLGFSLLAVSQASAEEAYLSEDDFFYEDVGSEEAVADPLEQLNRFTFGVNDFLYENVLDPVASVYTAVTPDPVEVAADNFFDNLRYPVRLSGNLLQGRLRGAWVETGRFAINSTIGIGGILRPADEVDGFAPIKAEDAGQAFGVWGIGEGPYLVLPLLGPSNLRDLGGLLVDRSVNPTDEPFSAIADWDWEWELTFTAAEFIAASPGRLELYQELKGQSIDPYSSVKNSYIQFRRAAVEE